MSQAHGLQLLANPLGTLEPNNYSAFTERSENVPVLVNIFEGNGARLTLKRAVYRIVFLFNEMLNIIQNRLIKCFYFHFKYGIQNIHMLNYNFNLVVAVALKM